MLLNFFLWRHLKYEVYRDILTSCIVIISKGLRTFYMKKVVSCGFLNFNTTHFKLLFYYLLYFLNFLPEETFYPNSIT